MKRIKKIKVVAAFTLQALIFAPVPGHAETASETELSYLVVRQPIVQFLSQLERDTGLQIDATESVNGLIADMRLDGEIAVFLSQLSQRFVPQWFAFNGVLYVSA